MVAEAKTGSSNRLHTCLELLFFRLRDLLSPPEKKLVEVGLRPGWSVLDFGCGAGGYSIAAARLVGEHGKVYSVDKSPGALERVRSLASRATLSNVAAVRSDGELPIDDSTIDAVLLYDVLHDLDQPEQVLDELARVLRPEGILSFSDHHLREAQILARLTAGSRFKMLGKGQQTYTFARAEDSG